MVLKPLEYSDCLSDSPWFRQNLHDHESALDAAYKTIKQIETQCRDMVLAAQKLSVAQRSFARTLREFRFDTIGNTQTDDERVIANCLKEFGRLITQVEDQRDGILEEAEKLYIQPLKTFRRDRIGKALHDDKKKYDKSSGKFYQSLEKHLHLSTARKNDFREADASLEMEQRHFYQASLDYVFVLQSVQERMKFEFVETLSSFLYSWLSFYHVGHVIHEDFKPFLDSVQIKVQKAKESFISTQQEAEELKAKMLNVRIMQDGHANPPEAATSSIKQGYLFLAEKGKLKNLGNAWTKYYCVYQKESCIFTTIPYTQSAKTDMKGTFAQSTSMKLKSCTRRASDSIDKRFCFDITTDRSEGVLTFQALSEEDRRLWLDAMDGREPVYSPGTGPTKSFETALDADGFEFVSSCLSTVEERGLSEQGIYRNCGVTSKVQRLLQLGLDKRRGSADRLNLNDDKEWEMRTVTSAIKTFLRNLPEPMMTFELHGKFINAAKLDNRLDRLTHCHYYVYQLPADRFRMLKLVIEHLRRVADLSESNLMTVGNLGVCFGPTLLRPKEETLAAIMDIKFCNVVVEVLVENCVQIFSSRPSHQLGVPCPPKPAHVKYPSVEPSTSAATVTLSPLVGSQPNSRSHERLDQSTPGKTSALAMPAVRTRPLAIYGQTGDPAGVRPMNNSCDSLNSVDSAVTNSESSPSPNRSQDSTNSKPDRRARMSISYAPPYPGDIFQKRLSGSNLLSNSLSHLQGSSPFIAYLNPPVHIQPSGRVRTLYECTAGHDSELSFLPAQIITNVYQSKEPGWLVGTLNGKTGLIPSNYVEPLP